MNMPQDGWTSLSVKRDVFEEVKQTKKDNESWNDFLARIAEEFDNQE